MNATLTGDRELDRILRTLGEKVQKRVLRGAVNAATNPILKSARTKAPKESGLLRKSLGKKVKAYRSGTVVGIVGPRKEIVGEYKGQKRRPAFYAHLVENGHIDPTGRAVPPQPFLRPAMDQTEGAVRDIMKSKLADGVVREAKKR